MTPESPGDRALERPPSGRAAARTGGWWRWAVAVAYMALLFTLSAQSDLPSPPVDAVLGVPIDKIEHTGAYAVLAALVTWAVAGGWRLVTWRSAVTAIVVASAFGYSDEFHQRFVPHRTYDLYDWAADTAGASLGAAGTWAWSILFRGRS